MEPEKLSTLPHAGINDPAATIFVSAASSWELATRFSLGKLPGAEGLLQDLPSLQQQQGPSRWQCSCIKTSMPLATRRPTGIPTAARKTASSIDCWRPRLN